MHQRLLSFSFSCTVVCPHLLFRFFHSSVMIYSLVYVASICLFPLHISICLGKQTMAILFVAQLSASSHELQIHYWSYNLCYCFVASGKPICSILVPLKEQSVIVYCHRYVYCLLTTAFVAALMSDNSLLTSFKVSPTGSSDHCTQFRIRRCSSLFRLHLISFVQWAELLCGNGTSCESSTSVTTVYQTHPCGGSHAHLSLWRLCCLLSVSYIACSILMQQHINSHQVH